VLDRKERTLDGAAARLARQDVRLRLAASRHRLDLLYAALHQGIRSSVGRVHAAIAPLTAKLEQLSPLKILERGYAIVEHAGKVVKSPADAPEGVTVDMRVARGRLKARIISPERG
jgi:exodeoxyribonuclease VII large subunit